MGVSSAQSAIGELMPKHQSTAEHGTKLHLAGAVVTFAPLLVV